MCCTVCVSARARCWAVLKRTGPWRAVLSQSAGRGRAKRHRAIRQAGRLPVVPCRDRIVLADQAAKEITPPDLWHDLHRIDVALLLRYSKLDPAVRSLGVVVTGVAREDTVEMTAAEDQGPVQGLVPQRLHAALGKRVGLG